MTIKDCIMVIRPTDDLFRMAELLDLPEDEDGNRIMSVKNISVENVPTLNTVPYRPDHLK